MPRERSDFLTHYASPDEATAEELAVARAACQLMCGGMPRDQRDYPWDEFFEAAGRLLVWSRQLLTRIARKKNPGKRVRSERDSRSEATLSTRQLAAMYLNENSDEPVAARSLVTPEDWSGLQWWSLRPLLRHPRLRAQLAAESIAWIDSAQCSNQSALDRNIGFLASGLSLNEAEQTLVKLVALSRESQPLRAMLATMNVSNVRFAAQLLTASFGVRPELMQQALQPSAILVRLGLVSTNDPSDLDDICRGSNDRIYSSLQQPHADARAFFASFLKPAPCARISADDVPHLAKYLDLATRLLGKALAEGERGINVLLHGIPGAGKTEFARLIAAAIGAQLFEVDCEGEKGASASFQERWAALMLASRALKGCRDAMLVFDEAEDAFPESESYWPWNARTRNERCAKAWVNATLESNPVPVVWISNCIDGVDPAYLRRFALHVRFPELPTTVKRRLTERYLCGVPVGEEVKEEIARLPSLTPGQLETASRVVRLCQPAEAKDAEQVLGLQLRAQREALGLESPRGLRDRPIRYRPDFVNLREPMSVTGLIEGLRTHSRAALCFFGAPGTGKTELAHYLASELGRELVFKSASDLLSPWVGVTEKRIAALFAEAEDRVGDVIVLLDESDTFLRDRTLARHSWEASQTNEFLARMERFPGIFVCTTNLVETLDLAILRRFNFRIEFLPLREEQSLAAFAETFGRPPSGEEQARLGELSGLVPADFANVARQMRFLSGAVDPILFLSEELRTRLGAKPSSRPIGFIRSAPGERSIAR